MMEQYKQEMALPVALDAPQKPVEQSVVVFESASSAVKKQIVFELVALACADNEYADTEHSLLEKIGGVFGLDEAFLGECKVYVRELTALYEKIGKLVGE